MRRQTKEIPNTKNVVVWPEEILKQIRIVEAYDMAQERTTEKSSHAHPNKSNMKEIKRAPMISENFEYYAFLTIGSIVWLLVARAVLKWHKFPFHRHIIEVGLIYTCPILIIILLLYCVDFGTRKIMMQDSIDKRN